MKRVRLEGLVTVLDCGTFLADYASRAPLMARPELGEGGNLRPVVDLLVEQLECADYVLLNKTDLLEEGQLDELRPIVASLNPFATVRPGHAAPCHTLGSPYTQQLRCSSAWEAASRQACQSASMRASPNNAVKEEDATNCRSFEMTDPSSPCLQ